MAAEPSEQEELDMWLLACTEVYCRGGAVLVSPQRGRRLQGLLNKHGTPPWYAEWLAVAKPRIDAEQKRRREEEWAFYAALRSVMGLGA